MRSYQVVHLNAKLILPHIIYDNALTRATPVRPCIPGRGKRRPDLKELEEDVFSPRSTRKVLRTLQRKVLRTRRIPSVRAAYLVTPLRVWIHLGTGPKTNVSPKRVVRDPAGQWFPAL
ncbi:hypothetical protein J6590_027052 [Homalodisca vitripennis]|nr:hypothetical protein J6590_027052 [Homalodisca vitripennis]